MKHSIYLLYEPDTLLVRYVGITIDVMKRLKSHITEAQRNTSHTRKNNWIRALLNRGLTPGIIVAAVANADEYREEAEVSMISYVASQGADLVNGTGGGAGSLGRAATDTTKMKISKANTGRKMKPEVRVSLTEALRKYNSTRQITDQMRQNMSEAQKIRQKVRAKPITALGETNTIQEWAVKTGLSIAVLRQRLKRGLHPDEALSTPVGQLPVKPLSESARQKIANSQKGRKATAEAREKMSKSRTGLKRSEDAIRRTAAKVKGLKRTPEQIERIRKSAASRKRKQVVIFGMSKTIIEWCEYANIDPSFYDKKRKQGWSPEKIVTSNGTQIARSA
jgi:hypothetical protein